MRNGVRTAAARKAHKERLREFIADSLTSWALQRALHPSPKNPLSHKIVKQTLIAFSAFNHFGASHAMILHALRVNLSWSLLYTRHS